MPPTDPADYAAVAEWLYGLKPVGGKYGIDRMRRLAAELGHPERGLPAVHVAGTNGKGSVSAMLDAILHAAGWRTGLYTSPHLVNLGERVQVDRRVLPVPDLLAYVRDLVPVADRIAQSQPDERPSFFEYATAMAFLEFRRQRCDIAVIETGLGGRLDATNIVDPEVSVITSISLDHCEYLGDSLAAIAGEKAGIIKPGRPIVMGRVPPEAEVVIRSVAQAQGARLWSVAETYGDELEHYPHTNLEGEYQRWNAATATLAARALPARWKVTETAIAQGLAHVDWPGRWQRVMIGGRQAILDASHNPEGASVLDRNLGLWVAETGRPPVVITAALGATRARPLLETICRHAKEVHLVVPNVARACTHEELVGLVPPTFGGRVVRARIDDLFPAPDTCTAGTPDDTLVVTGSIYLLGEAMARLGPVAPRAG
ncbi:MAG: bifunctional folylpolyglutamate synthase/dihydrofolate synthase [Verrucomicrobia bacterium]|nr:bifunctional folylpolyglutamate synthase/dihydrofolate synthase [Verrucomicrobiota bacterium]